MVSSRIDGRSTRRTCESSVAYGRVTESIDLIAATLGGDIKHHMIIPECLRRVMQPEEKARKRFLTKLRRLVYMCRGVFGRSGRDFNMNFAGWLIMNRWLTVPEAPAIHVLWA